MPRISSLAVGLLASLVFAAPGLGAEATFRVGNWVGEVRRDASGAFDFCAVSVRNRAEVFLTLQMDASGRLDLALSSRLWTLNRGDYIGAKLIIDNRAIGGFFGRVPSREMMKINLHGPATLRYRIARSRLLGVRIAGEEHGFAMDGSGRAMAALDTCVAAARETKPAVEPVARPARSHKSVPRPTTKPALAETPARAPAPRTARAETPAPGATRAARKPDPPARTASLPDPHPFGRGPALDAAGRKIGVGGCRPETHGGGGPRRRDLRLSPGHARDGRLRRRPRLGRRQGAGLHPAARRPGVVARLRHRVAASRDGNPLPRCPHTRPHAPGRGRRHPGLRAIRHLPRFARGSGRHTPC